MKTTMFRVAAGLCVFGAGILVYNVWFDLPQVMPKVFWTLIIVVTAISVIGGIHAMMIGDKKEHPMPEPRNEKTSARVLAIAARGVRDPHTLTLEEIQSVCASCLTQGEDAPTVVDGESPRS